MLQLRKNFFRQLLFTGLLGLNLGHSLAWAQSSCEEDLNPADAKPEIKKLLESVCDYGDKALSKKIKSDDFDFEINPKKIEEGYIQTHMEMFTLKEFKDHPYNSIDPRRFTNHGNILANEMVFLVPKKNASFFSLNHQTSDDFIKKCFYASKLKGDCPSGLPGTKVIEKTVKISVPIPGFGTVEETFDMTGEFSIYDHQSKTFEGALSAQGDKAQSLVNGTLAINKKLKLPPSYAGKINLGEPVKTIFIEITKAPMGVHGSMGVTSFYDLGENDSRYLVVTHQLASLNPAFPQSKTLEEAVLDVLNSSSIFKRPIKSAIQDKIFHRTCFEFGMTLDNVRNSKNKK